MSKETKTRGVLKRTKKKYAQHPTPGRKNAIEKYEQHLAEKERLRIIGSVSPCPCCGNINLYVGPMSCDTMGVHCRSGEDMIDRLIMARYAISQSEFRGCGLQIAVPLPDEYPANFPRRLCGNDALERLRQLILQEAIRRWNQRANAQ